MKTTQIRGLLVNKPRQQLQVFLFRKVIPLSKPNNWKSGKKRKGQAAGSRPKQRPAELSSFQECTQAGQQGCLLLPATGT